MYPSFTVRKRDRILDAFSIKSERTRGELGLTRSRLRSTIPDVHHPTARNEITFSHALGNILIRPSPRHYTPPALPRQLDDLAKLLHQLLALYFSFPPPLSALPDRSVLLSRSPNASSGVIHRAGQQ